jgi:hypothetical protein
MSILIPLQMIKLQAKKETTPPKYVTQSIQQNKNDLLDIDELNQDSDSNYEEQTSYEDRQDTKTVEKDEEKQR